MDDRSLDAMVAENVFGWKWATFLTEHYLLHPFDYEQNKPEAGYLGWTPGKKSKTKEARTEDRFIDSSRPYPRYRTIEPYSTDIAAAFEVGKKVGGCWGLQYGPAAKLWTANFCPRMGDLTTRASGQNPARAICFAALAALGVEVLK